MTINQVCYSIKPNGLAMNSTGANWRLLSATHIAKSQRFCGLHKNTQTLRLSPKPVFFIGLVVHRLFPQFMSILQ